MVESDTPENDLTGGETGRRRLLRDKGRAWLKAAREVFFGLTVYELEVELRRDRGDLERLFFLSVFGDLVGLPLLPPYYSMRLLPHIVPHIGRWKRSLLRERDITDLASRDF